MPTSATQTDDYICMHIHNAQANANASSATKAILAGLKKRFDETGKKPLFFHTVRALLLRPKT